MSKILELANVKLGSTVIQAFWTPPEGRSVLLTPPGGHLRSGRGRE